MFKQRKWTAAFTLIVFSLFSLFVLGCDLGLGQDDDDDDDDGFPSQNPPTEYTITVTGGITNGVITASLAKAAEGTSVTVTIAPAANYRLKPGTFSVKNEAGGAIAVNGEGPIRTFTMPASNVTVTGEFDSIAAAVKYNITSNVTGSGGTIKIHDEHGTDITQAAEGQFVIVTIQPTAGNRLAPNSFSVKKTDNTDVTFSGSSNTRDFAMPGSDVTVSAAFEAHNITISGTVTARVDGNIPEYVSVTMLEKIDEHSLSVIDEDVLDYSSTTWSITIPALTSPKTAYFTVTVELDGFEETKLVSVTVPIFDQDVSNVALGTHNFTTGGEGDYISLSGTVNVSINGKTPDYMFVIFWESGYYGENMGVEVIDGSYNVSGIPQEAMGMTVYAMLQYGYHDETQGGALRLGAVTLDSANTVFNIIQTVTTKTISGTVDLNITINGITSYDFYGSVQASASGNQVGSGDFNPYDGTWSMEVLSSVPDTLEFAVWLYNWAADDVYWVPLGSHNITSTVNLGTVSHNFTLAPVVIPSITTTLTEAVWKHGSVGAGEEVWYSFDATPGTYYIWCNDNYYGYGSDPKTADIAIDVYDKDGNSILKHEDPTYENYASFTVSAGGKIYIKAYPYGNDPEDPWDIGTYAIVFRKNDTRPAYNY